MARAPRLRYEDPHKRRGRLYLAVCRFSGSEAGGWLAVNVAWKLDPHLLRLTSVRCSGNGPVPSRLLETRGAHSGE